MNSEAYSQPVLLLLYSATLILHGKFTLVMTSRNLFRMSCTVDDLFLGSKFCVLYFEIWTPPPSFGVQISKQNMHCIHGLELAWNRMH